MLRRLCKHILIAAVVTPIIFLFAFSTAAADTLATLFATDNQYAGNMFNLTNLSAYSITIDSFDVNITSKAGVNASVSVYYRAGGYTGYEIDASAWTLAGNVSVASNGLNVPTPVAVGNITIPAGETYGIYLTVDNYLLPDIRMYYTNGTTTYENDDLRLSGSIGRGTPSFTGSVIGDRIWNGSVYYTLQIPTPTPMPTLTPAPTAAPPDTGDPFGSMLFTWLGLVILSAAAVLGLMWNVIKGYK